MTQPGEGRAATVPVPVMACEDRPVNPLADVAKGSDPSRLVGYYPATRVVP